MRVSLHRADMLSEACERATQKVRAAEHNVRVVRQELGESLYALGHAHEQTKILNLARNPYATTLTPRYAAVVANKVLTESQIREGTADQLLAEARIRVYSRRGVSALDTLQKARLDAQKAKDRV